MNRIEVYEYVSKRVSEELDKQFKRVDNADENIEIKTVDISAKITDDMDMGDIEKLVSEIVEDISQKVWKDFSEKLYKHLSSY